ncbi:MAG: hypothetical protein K5659_07550, partial [Lachnospiraceae bacterium]|nr:hypothetical protein [Lachnospiraceae bacterium]
MKEVDEKVVEEAEVKKEEPVFNPNAKYLEIAEYVGEAQRGARLRLINVMYKSVHNNTNFFKSLKVYTDKIREYADETKDPEAVELLNTLDGFNEKTAKIADLEGFGLDFGESIDQKTADDYFYSKNGFRDTFLAIKRFKANHKSPLDLVSKSEAMCDGFDAEITASFEQAKEGKIELDHTVCYIAQHSGDFNIAEGEELLEGISKVCTAYQYISKGESYNFNVNRGYDTALLTYNGNNRIRKNKAFKKYFTLKGTDKLDVNLLQETVKNGNEWEAAEYVRF